MRLTTLNVENLFTRFRFQRNVDPQEAVRDGFLSEDLRFRVEDPEGKRLTADLVLELDSDVFALQEVESLQTLKTFRQRFLGGIERWPHALAIDGNDERGIDVAVLSKLPIVHARSWQHLVGPDGTPVFDRDCLEVDVLTEQGPLTLFINHFKSMRGDDPEVPGRAQTRPRRVHQAAAVRQIVEQRFGPDPGEAAFVILGDLNDHLIDDDEGRSAIRDLVAWEAVSDITTRLAESERWTHFFRGNDRSNRAPAYHQLDWMLPSRRLAAVNHAAPELDRRGQPKRAERYDGPRFTGTGWDRPKASDHCPISWEIDRLG